MDHQIQQVVMHSTDYQVLTIDRNPFLHITTTGIDCLILNSLCLPDVTLCLFDILDIDVLPQENTGSTEHPDADGSGEKLKHRIFVRVLNRIPSW